MPHDETLSILISGENGDDTEELVFHFLHIDGDGRERHSDHYATEEIDHLYGWQRDLIGYDYLTRSEVNSLRKVIRRHLKVRKV